MTTKARGEFPVYDGSATAAADLAGAASRLRDVADLVRRCSGLEGRYGFRVVARGLSGHIFFDSGRVIHAEFGEDVGLRAVLEMLRVGPVLLEGAVLPWPSQPSLHLGPELLLSMTERDASRVMRRVDLPVEPPPLPDPDAPIDDAAIEDAPAEAVLVAPVQPGAARSSGVRRAIRKVLPRVEPRVPLASSRVPRGAAPVSPARPAPARSASIPMSSITPRAASEPAGVRPSAPRLAPAPVVPAREVRSRAVVVSRSGRPAPASEPAAAGPPLAGFSPALEPTRMVRVTPRGDVLAEHGRDAQQLAEAAAFIHGLANLIAADLGRAGAPRTGRANVHLSGAGVSLLVARSEVNDIAAALGPSERVASLLRKVGFKG